MLSAVQQNFFVTHILRQPRMPAPFAGSVAADRQRVKSPSPQFRAQGTHTYHLSERLWCFGSFV